MTLTVKEYRRRLERFNRWEEDYNRGKDPTRRLEEFLILYDLNFYASQEKKTQAHRAHLEHVIECRQRIKRSTNYMNLSTN